MSLGVKLRNLRHSKNLSQAEIADRLKVSQPAYHLWETDQAKPTTENLLRISEIYETDVYDLLDEKSIIQTNNDKAIGYIEGAVTINNTISEEIIENILKNQQNITLLIESQNKLIESLLKK